MSRVDVALRPRTRAGWSESVLLLVVRVALGGVFLYAAWNKLIDPQYFAESVKAFGIIPLDRALHLAVLTTFLVPWTEVFTGLALVVGVRTRAAGLLLSAMLLVFTAAIVSAIVAGKKLECGCFGELSWPCAGPVGACHVVRNAVLLVASLLIAWRGAGRASLDHALAGPGAREVDDEAF